MRRSRTTRPAMTAAIRPRRCTPPPTPADRNWEKRSPTVLTIDDLLEALGADTFPVGQQHHIGFRVWPVDGTRARGDGFDQSAVTSLPNAKSERRELHHDENEEGDGRHD